MNQRWILFLAFIWQSAAAVAAPVGSVPVDHAARMVRGLDLFQHDIRPILLEQCLFCHGGTKTEGGLDLVTREGLLRGGSGGAVITVYNGRSSRLIDVVSRTTEVHPTSKGARLSRVEVERLKGWIDAGAPYDEPLIKGRSIASKKAFAIGADERAWWAFQPLGRSAPPTVRQSRWVKTPVDRFILAGLESKSLKPNPEADRRTLIRRASFDLLGLPPSPEEVEAFVGDTSTDAWSKVVSRLLASPRYGERWARHWLDVARFAESSGFEHDYDRPGAYHFRDFVIRALNEDMPYDQFVRWQIAGDEFEPKNVQALMATGFLGAGVFPTQITANEVERVRYDAMDDMLATTGTAMLGLTVGCARCHDHKFDPIAARDYYRMLSTFTTTVRSDVELDLDPSATQRVLERYKLEHDPLVGALRKYEETELPKRLGSWMASGATMPASEWQLITPTTSVSKAGASFRQLGDGSQLVEGVNGESDTYTFRAKLASGGWRALRVEALAHPSMKGGGPGRADNGNIGLSRVRLFASNVGAGTTGEVRLVKARATFEQNSTTLSVGSALDLDPKTGWALDPHLGTNHAAVFEFEAPIGSEAGVELEVRLEFAVNTRHTIGRPRLSISTQSAPSLTGMGLPLAIAALLEKNRLGGGTGVLTAADTSLLLDWRKPLEPEWVRLQAAVEAHGVNPPKPKLTHVLICGEGYPALRMHSQGADFYPETYFLNRGSPDAKRGVATAGFLQVLLPDPAEETRWSWTPPSGSKGSGRRRSLATWMTDSERGAGHLVARVIVNRMWQHHFGQGLVATPNDFGKQGTKPSHPELLDWMASELIRNGWHLKPLHQLLMTSAVYRQSSATTSARVLADPNNVLLTRRIPQRLEAEAIRDSLLSVCGVLATNLYGPGTLDEASRRRSIYFTVKRSQLVSSMQSFDAPEPLVSQGIRPVTTVAPQALWLMNSPHVRSWAAAFAKRSDQGTDRPLVDAVRRGYLLALNRLPTSKEQVVALRFLEGQQARYQGANLADPRGTALIDFAQTLLSLNEFLYVD